MKLIELLAKEFENEAKTTRKHLERLPDDKLEWRPHEKSFTARALASHIVECMDWAESLFTKDELNIDFRTYKPYQASSTADLLATMEANVAKGKQAFAASDDAHLEKPWRLLIDGKVWFERPRVEVLRDFVLSHLIHHRGQLSLYLRLLNIPVPGSYGPSADDPPPPGM
jgi:uncharacterized damage-inducible protein DinB